MHYLLFYDYTPDYLQRRAEFRDQHLKLAWEGVHQGRVLLGGVLADPVDGAVILFQADSAEEVERFVRQDPYVKGGLVKSWRIRPWSTVVGEAATTPVKPEP